MNGLAPNTGSTTTSTDGGSPALDQERVAREAADILADRTMSFTGLERQPQEQWSEPALTMDEYQKTARDEYPDLYGEKTTENIGRIEFLKKRMEQGATSEERQQAQEKLAAAFGIDTTGKSDSQILTAIEISYRDVLNEIRDAGQEQDRNIMRPDRLDAEMRTLQDRLEATQEQITIARARAGYRRGAGRALRTLEARERSIQRTIDERTERITTGEGTYHENMEIGRAQDRVTVRLAQRGRQGLAGGLNVDELFDGSRAMQREGGDMFYDPGQYAQETAEARVRIQDQRNARGGPRTITPDESTPTTGPGRTVPTGSGNPMDPATYNTPGSTYIDRTGSDARYFADRQHRQEMAEFNERIGRVVQGLRQQGQQDFTNALRTVSQGGDITAGSAVLNDERLGYLRKEIYDRVTTQVQAGTLDRNGPLANLFRQMSPISRGRMESGPGASIDARTLVGQPNAQRAQLVARMSDDRVQQVDAYLRAGNYSPNSAEGRLAGQIAQVMTQRGLEQVATPAPNVFERRQPPTSAYGNASVTPAAPTPAEAKQMAMGIYNQLKAESPEERTQVAAELLGDISDPAMRSAVLEQVNKVRTGQYFRDPSLIAMQAELTGIRDARNPQAIASRVYNAIQSGMEADVVMAAITNPQAKADLLEQIERAGGAHTNSAIVRSMYNSLSQVA